VVVPEPLLGAGRLAILGKHVDHRRPNILFELESLSVSFQSLKDSWCDTTSPAGKFMLTIFGGIAEFEHEAKCCRPRSRQLIDGNLSLDSFRVGWMAATATFRGSSDHLSFPGLDKPNNRVICA
jgi:hypothetical protein